MRIGKRRMYGVIGALCILALAAVLVWGFGQQSGSSEESGSKIGTYLLESSDLPPCFALNDSWDMRPSPEDLWLEGKGVTFDCVENGDIKIGNAVYEFESKEVAENDFLLKKDDAISDGHFVSDSVGIVGDRAMYLSIHLDEDLILYTVYFIEGNRGYLINLYGAEEFANRTTADHYAQIILEKLG